MLFLDKNGRKVGFSDSLKGLYRGRKIVVFILIFVVIGVCGILLFGGNGAISFGGSGVLLVGEEYEPLVAFCQPCSRYFYKNDVAGNRHLVRLYVYHSYASSHLGGSYSYERVDEAYKTSYDLYAGNITIDSSGHYYKEVNGEQMLLGTSFSDFFQKACDYHKEHYGVAFYEDHVCRWDEKLNKWIECLKNGKARSYGDNARYESYNYAEFEDEECRCLTEEAKKTEMYGATPADPFAHPPAN